MIINEINLVFNSLFFNINVNLNKYELSIIKSNYLNGVNYYY